MTFSKSLFVLITCTLLFILIIPYFVDIYRDKSAEHVFREVKLISAALYLFNIDTGAFPLTSDGLDILTATLNTHHYNNWNGPYLEDISYIDIWNSPYIYIYPARYSNQDFDLYSIGINKKDEFGDGDDISLWGGINEDFYGEIKIRWK